MSDSFREDTRLAQRSAEFPTRHPSTEPMHENLRCRRTAKSDGSGKATPGWAGCHRVCALLALARLGIRFGRSNARFLDA